MESVIDCLAGDELVSMGVSGICYFACANSFAPFIQICLLSRCIGDMGTDVGSIHIRLACKSCIGSIRSIFDEILYVAHTSCIVLISIGYCVFAIGSLSSIGSDVGNLSAIEISAAIRIQGNLCTRGLITSSGLIADGSNAGQVLSQLHIIGYLAGGGIGIAVELDVLAGILVLFPIGGCTTLHGHHCMGTGFGIHGLHGRIQFCKVLTCGGIGIDVIILDSLTVTISLSCMGFRIHRTTGNKVCIILLNLTTIIHIYITISSADVEVLTCLNTDSILINSNTISGFNGNRLAIDFKTITIGIGDICHFVINDVMYITDIGCILRISTIVFAGGRRTIATCYISDFAIVDIDVLIFFIQRNLCAGAVCAAGNGGNAGEVFRQFHIIGDFTGRCIGIAVELDVLAGVQILAVFVLFTIGLRSAFYSESCMGASFGIKSSIGGLQVAQVDCIFQGIPCCRCNGSCFAAAVFCVSQCTLHMGNSRIIRAITQGNLRLVDGLAISLQVILNRTAIHSRKVVCVLLYLCIQSTQVLCCSLGSLYICPISCRPYFAVYGAAGDQLFATLSRIIGNGAGTQGLAPGIFVGSFSCIRCIGFCNGFSIIADGVGLQISANVRCVRFGIRFQLFHDHGIMGILTVGDFNKAVVSSRRVLILGYRFWGLRIVVGRAIGIALLRRQLFPLDGIAGDIACIMTESNGIRFIRRSLIADGRAIFRGDDCLMASCQSTDCVFAGRTASNAYRRTTSYRTVVDDFTIRIVSSQAANSSSVCSQYVILGTANGSCLLTNSCIHDTTAGC